jgi:hypothetical protein
MKVEAAARLASARPSSSKNRNLMPYRSVSIGSEFDTTTNTNTNTTTSSQEDTAVFLLLSMSKIVKQEIQEDASLFDNDDDEDMEEQDDQHTTLLTRRLHTQSPTSDEERFTWNRVRTVSIDSPPQVPHAVVAAAAAVSASMMAAALPSGVAAQHLRLPNFVSPTTSPAVARAGRPLRKTSLRLCQKKRKQLKLPKMANSSTVPHHSHPSPSTTTTTAIISTTPSGLSDAKELKKKALQFSAARGTTLKKILRKKFSWKNYPGM